MTKGKPKKAPAPAVPQSKMIYKLNDYDILCGRGNGVNNTSGNVRFRKLIDTHRPVYVVAARRDKAEIAKEVVAIIQRNGGRFLRLDEKLSCWLEIPAEKALEKTCQALREDANILKRQPSPETTPRVKRRTSLASEARKISSASKAETTATKRVAPKKPVSEQADSKQANRSKIDMGQEAQSARNKMLDSLWKEEQVRRQRAKEVREARMSAKNTNDNVEPKFKQPKPQESAPGTPSLSVPKHRLMSPLGGNSKPDATNKGGKDDETAKFCDNSGVDENNRGNFQTTKSVKANGCTPMDVTSSQIEQDAIGLGFTAVWFKDEEWEDMFSQLVAFKKNIGHCAVPPGWSENTRLADWASYQRQIKREVAGYRSPTAVESTRLDRLSALGFVWDYEAWHWERRYQELREVTEDSGGLMVPQRSVMEHWIRDQKKQFQDGVQGRFHLMRPDRVLLFSKAMLQMDDMM